ncbi:SUMF1/EgtB/PvdO family nonheme iron enzyme [Verrucomicrobiales bacterium]|nr:SUMF1/EgtB/PvdO family nonheme iron enzyme [Verrucomicrobiales bacterium]
MQNMKAEIYFAIVSILILNMSNSIGQDREQLLGIEWVVVGDAGNPGDDSAQGRGAVGYEFKISKYEITASQWVLYLNNADPFGIQELGGRDEIIKERTRPDGEIYYVKDGFEDYPVRGNLHGRYMVKFCNWLHGVNHTDPIAYNSAKERMPTAKYWIPNVDEWHKAAYYQGNGLWAPYSTGFEINNKPPPGDSHSANFDRSGFRTLPVGSYPDAVGHYGTLDMTGNVGERLIDRSLIAGGHYQQSEFYQKASTRLLDGNGTSSSNMGFRLASISGDQPDPQPAQLDINPAIELTWVSVKDQAYKVQSSLDMDTWEDDETVLGTGKRISLLRRQDPEKRFWRVKSL